LIFVEPSVQERKNKRKVKGINANKTHGVNETASTSL
jgi:hypothetical protein